MNTLGKTLVSLGICIVILLTLFLTRDIGAPSGMVGEGFQTMKECLQSGIGASYDIQDEIGHVTFDDGVIYIIKSKDEKIVVSYLFLNSQGTKYYLDSYFIVDDINDTHWLVSENKVKTNYRLTSQSESITTCDNLPVQMQEYSIVLDEQPTTIRLYYNRVGE